MMAEYLTGFSLTQAQAKETEVGQKLEDGWSAQREVSVQHWNAKGC